MAIKRQPKVVDTMFKDAAYGKGADAADYGVSLVDGDINDLKLVIGVKIAGEPSDLIDDLPSGK